MKKLMTVLAATAMSFGLFADTVETTVNLHGFEVGEEDVTDIDAPLYLDAEIDGFKVWDAGETNPTLVKAYKDGEALDEEAGESYLGIETDGTPLFRGFANSDGDAVNFGDAYVSTYVQFTAADSAPTSLDGSDAKIALWLQEDEDAGTTNLMVSCGIIDAGGSVSETTNVALVAEGIEPNSWHKVTIKPVLDEAEGQTVGVGFLVYLDDATSPLAVKDKVTLVDSSWAELYSKPIQDFIDAGKYLPSRVTHDSNPGVSDKLAGIAFDGTGAIDNLDITTDEPFPPTYAITAIEPENGTYTVTDEEGKEITAALAGATVTVIADPEDGYVLDAITVVGADTTPVDVIDGVFEMPAQAVTVTVTFTAESKDWPEPDDPTIKDKNAKEAFGDKVPNDLANVPASKFAAWAKKAGIDFENPEGITKDAYLLDCAPDKVNEEKAKFKIVSIEFIDDEWVVKVTGEKAEGDDYTPNAKVVINDITETLDSEVKSATDAKGFFRATLDFND